MPNALTAFLAVLLLPLVWGAIVFNRFVGMRNRCRNAWAQIDVQLKRRYDLVPNLVSATRAYLAHERQTLEAVVAARQRAADAHDQARVRRKRGAPAADEVDAIESELSAPLSRLLALVEQYPELKADETVGRLTEELRSTENRIGFARQAYNDQVTVYNTAVESFPGTLVATLCGFRQSSTLRATSSPRERETVSVAL